MSDPTFDTGLTDPLYDNADLPAKARAVPQPLQPAPYYVSRGNPSYYGYRHGVVVVTLGPGGVAASTGHPEHTSRDD